MVEKGAPKLGPRSASDTAAHAPNAAEPRSRGGGGPQTTHKETLHAEEASLKSRTFSTPPLPQQKPLKGAGGARLAYSGSSGQISRGGTPASSEKSVSFHVSPPTSNREHSASVSSVHATASDTAGTPNPQLPRVRESLSEGTIAGAGLLRAGSAGMTSVKEGHRDPSSGFPSKSEIPRVLVTASAQELDTQVVHLAVPRESLSSGSRARAPSSPFNSSENLGSSPAERALARFADQNPASRRAGEVSGSGDAKAWDMRGSLDSTGSAGSLGAVSPSPTKTFLLAERSQVGAFLPLGLVKSGSSVVVSGYRLYVVTDWLLDGREVFWTCAEKTGNDADSIVFQPLRLPGRSSEHHQRMISTLFDPPDSSDFRREKTSKGSLLVCKDFVAFAAKRSVLLIEDGDFERHSSAILRQLTLYRMHCGGDPPVEPTDAAGSSPRLVAMEEQFLKLYGKYLYEGDLANLSQTARTEKVHIAARQVICHVQRCLTLLGFYDGPQEGEYTKDTVFAVSDFQASYNDREDAKFELTTSGRLNPATLAVCFEIVDDASSKLQALGFGEEKEEDAVNITVYSNPVSFDEFRAAVRKFQAAQKIAGETSLNWGFLDATTLTVLNSLVALPIQPSTTEPTEGADQDQMELELQRRLGNAGFQSDELQNRRQDRNLEAMEPDDLLKHIAGRRFALVEIELAMTVWKREIPEIHFGDIADLPGYRLCVIEEDILDDLERIPGRAGAMLGSYNFPCVRIIETGNVDDTITCVSVHVPRSISAEHALLLRSRLMMPIDHESHYFSENTKLGALCVFSPPDEQMLTDLVAAVDEDAPYTMMTSSGSGTTFVPVDGHYDDHIRSMQLQLTLRRLGAGNFQVVSSDEDESLGQLESKFRSLYAIGSSSDEPLDQVVFSFVEKLQAALLLLHFYGRAKDEDVLERVDGIYGRETMAAVATFQGASGMPVSGRMNGRTYEELFQRIMKLKAHMAAQGYDIDTEDPFGDFNVFAPVVLSFEAAGFRAKGIQHAAREDRASRPVRQNSSSLSLGESHSQETAPRELPEPGRRGKYSTTSMGVGLQQAVLRFHDKHSTAKAGRPALRRSVATSNVSGSVQDEQALMRKVADAVRSDAEAAEAEVVHAEQRLESLSRLVDQLDREKSELSDGLRRYERELDDMRKQYNNLAREYSSTVELMRDNSLSVAGYRDKIGKLEKRLHDISRTTRYKNLLTAFGTTVLSWVLSVVAIVVLVLSYVSDFFVNRWHAFKGEKAEGDNVRAAKAQLEKAQGRLDDMRDETLLENQALGAHDEAHSVVPDSLRSRLKPSFSRRFSEQGDAND